MKKKQTKGIKHNQSLVPLYLILAVVVIGIGALVYNAVRTNRGNPIINTQDDVPRVSVGEAYQAVMAGEAVLVDTRSVEQFETQHAAGAISLPVSEVEARLGELDADIWYITYCT